MPPPPDTIDDTSQALAELSTNVNDFMRLQAKVRNHTSHPGGGCPAAAGRARVVRTPVDATAA
jgi:hypothetical protein